MHIFFTLREDNTDGVLLCTVSRLSRMKYCEIDRFHVLLYVLVLNQIKECVDCYNEVYSDAHPVAG